MFIDTIVENLQLLTRSGYAMGNCQNRLKFVIHFSCSHYTLDPNKAKNHIKLTDIAAITRRNRYINFT